MAAPDLRSMIQVGYDILTTTVNATTKKILAQLGNVHKETTDTDNAEWWQHIGFASRPPKPEAKKRAAQAVVFRAGDHDVILASQDLRGLELYGNLDHGETCIYAPGEDGTAQARVLLKKNGSIHLFTKKGNDASGKGITFSINSDGSVNLTTSEGCALMLGSDGSAKMFTPKGSVSMESGGAMKVAAEGKLSLSGTSVVIGGGTGSAVVCKTELVVLLNALVAALNLITPGATTTGGAPAAGALQGAIAAFEAAMALKRTSAA